MLRYTGLGSLSNALDRVGASGLDLDTTKYQMKGIKCTYHSKPEISGVIPGSSVETVRNVSDLSVKQTSERRSFFGEIGDSGSSHV